MILNIALAPITKEEAENEIKLYKKIRQKGDGKARAAFNSQSQTFKEQGHNYHDSTYNAFYFSRDEVLKFFFGKDIPAVPSTGDPAEGILIIQGCHDVDKPIGGIPFKKGTPTVILSGVKSEIVGGEPKLRTIDPAFSYGDAATKTVVEQYPPQKVSSTFTQIGSNNIYIID